MEKKIGSQLQAEMQIIKSDMEELRALTIKTTPVNVDNILTFRQFVNKYNEFDFPLKSNDEFILFCDHLKNPDSLMKNDLVNKIIKKKKN